MSGGESQTPTSGADQALSAARVEEVAREFTSVYHELKEQTFGTTTWLRVPLVKTPADMLAFQEIIAETRPELIIETGVYVGGSALMFASVMELLGIDGAVVAVDVDLSVVSDRVRAHPAIELIEGSSTDPQIVDRIRERAGGKRVMVDLDADHRAHHVLEELRVYSPLVTPGCYLVVEDGFLGGRPVRPEAVPGPSEAIDAWLQEEPPFEADRWRERFLLTQNPRGYLRRIDHEDEGPPGPPRPSSFVTGALELTPSASDIGQAPEPEEALEELRAAAGEPDGEVAALQRRMGTTAGRPVGGDRTIENLLGEIDVQRELLRERNRLLARERARLRRIESSKAYRAYRLLRGLPGVRQLAARRDRRRAARATAQRAQRAKTRRERTERFVDHHRGQ
ncbi:MAG: CmcI family methyltransferase [Solirubrobacterales bacterium]